jgi:hypothetical protein
MAITSRIPTSMIAIFKHNMQTQNENKHNVGKTKEGGELN